MKANIVVKKLFVVFLILLGCSYLILLASSTYEAVVYPTSPPKMTLSQALLMESQNKPAFLFFRKPFYVSITDARWECASIKQVDEPLNRVDHTEGVFSNTSSDALVFVQLNGLHTCEQLQNTHVTGKLERFTRRPVAYESDANGSVRIGKDSEAITLELCTRCTASEARLFSIFFVLIPFPMWGLFVYGKCQRQNENSE